MNWIDSMPDALPPQLLDVGFRFKDIIFHTHPHRSDGVQAIVKFENGHWASIIGGAFDSRKGYFTLYGDGKETFEIWSSLCIKNNRDVKGWQDKRRVMDHLKYMQKLKQEIK